MDFTNPDTLRFASFLGALLLLLGVETFAAARRWQDGRLRRLGFHAGLSVFNTAILRVTVATPFLWWAGWVHAQGWGLAPALGLVGIWEIVATVVVIDMLDYWWHRFNHRLPLLWRFHKVHHQDTHVDVTTALRFHPGELMISAIVWSSWIVLWGPSIWGLAAAQASISLSALFHHTNIDFPPAIERGLRRVIVTPRFHTAHHTVTPRTGDANFSTVFIWWDHLFGTYREPDAEEMQHLGLPEARTTYLSPREALLQPWRSTNRDQSRREATRLTP